MSDTTRIQLPVRVQIDLNSRSRSREGWVRTRLANVAGQVTVGDVVQVFEPEDGVAARARVVGLDHVLGFAYLEVVWDSLTVDTVPDQGGAA